MQPRGYNNNRKNWQSEVIQMKVKGQIIIDPKIQHGKPVIRGTRVPVARIIAELAGGMTTEEVMREYEIGSEDVAAALAYAADLVEAHEFHPLPS
jgi:uncharacterized protein (DUF433 family)